MAHPIARLVRAATLRLSSRYIEVSRYATSSSKPDSGSGPATESNAAPEVGYQKSRKATKKQEKGADANAETASSSPKSNAGGSDEVAYQKAKKSPAQAAKDVKSADATTKSPPASSEKPTTPIVSAGENVVTSSGDVPAPESLLNAAASAVTSEGVVVEEVGYAPRRKVMPLPDDKTPVAEEEVVEIPGDGTAPPKRVFRRIFTPEPEYDYNLPLPRLIKLEAKKKPQPITLEEAIAQVKACAKAKFVETVEAHIQLGVNPKRSDQIVRGAVTLPHGSGRTVKVAVFADGPAADEARAAGADVVGTDELIDLVFKSGGKVDFEKCIAIPSVMPKLGKIARILGPRGMMPNPKMGTVTPKVGDAVRAAKQGRVDFRADKTSILHAPMGKVNFPNEALYDNIAAFTAAVLGAKPVGLKKSSRYAGYLVKYYLCSTMGPSFPVSIQSVAFAADKYVRTQEAAAQGA